MGKVTKVREEGGREGGGGKGKRGAREQQTRRGTEEGERGPVRSFVSPFLRSWHTGRGVRVARSCLIFARSCDCSFLTGRPLYRRLRAPGATVFLFVKIMQLQCKDAFFLVCLYLSFSFFLLIFEFGILKYVVISRLN